MTYPEPSKHVLNDENTKAIQRQGMPFAVVVGDQPLLKNEQPQEYENVIPFLGPIHTQSCIIYAVLKTQLSEQSNFIGQEVVRTV